jgi:hypothetical protein
LLLQIYIGQELLSYFFESVPTPRLRCTRHVVGCLRCAVQRCRARVACRTVPARGVRRRRPRLTAVRTHLIRISPSGPSLARHRHRPGAKCARHESVGRGSLLLTARHGTARILARILHLKRRLRRARRPSRRRWLRCAEMDGAVALSRWHRRGASGI